MKFVQISFSLLLFLFIISCSPEEGPPVVPVVEEKNCEGDVLLSTTADVNAKHFCKEFLGTVNIDTYKSIDQISLAGLKSLTKVHGDLLIYHQNIKSLEGLENLRHIGGNLRIYGQQLKSLKGLENLSHVGGEIKIFRGSLEEIALPALSYVGSTIEISENEKLTSITDFGSLEEAKNILIVQNPVLQDVSGFNDLKVMQSLKIKDNAELSLISGFGALNQMDYFTVDTNPKLGRISGFGKLETVGNNLHFLGNTALSDINSLNALEVVHGSLKLMSNHLDLGSAFESLTEVGGDLWIADNGHTGVMNSFNNLLRVKGDYLDLLSMEAESIAGFAKLEEAKTVRLGWNKAELISGFEGLAQIGGYLQIQFNPRLTLLSAFSSLRSTGRIEIRSNDKLTAVSVFDVIENINGELKITENAGLASITVGEQLTNIQGDIQILNNPSLKIISGFKGLTSEGRNISIRYNARLLSIEGFNAVAATDYLDINDNYQLKSVAAFQNLQRANRNFIIGGNPELTDLSGLRSLEEVGAILFVAGNRLSDLHAFSNLRVVGEVLKVESEPFLTSLDGLENLTSELEFVVIGNNPELIDISALGNLGGVRNYLDIHANYKLSICNNDFVCNLMNAGGKVYVNYNAPGCENVEVVKASCG